MTENTPDELFEPLEESEESLHVEEETFDGGYDGDEGPQTKPCIFCGATLHVRAKACSTCGHALGPFEPMTPKEYYRFFFCGLLIFMGGLMPCYTDGPLTITTMLGGLWVILGMGVMWSMWCAIYSGRFRMFWVVWTSLPAIWGVWRIIFAFKEGSATYKLMVASGLEGWGSLGNMFPEGAPPDWSVLRNFFSAIGYGPMMITFGSLLAWGLLLGGMFGAVKHSKKKAADRAAGGGRSRRR